MAGLLKKLLAEGGLAGGSFFREAGLEGMLPGCVGVGGGRGCV